MKSLVAQIGGYLFGVLVVMVIFHPERLLPFWWQTYSDPGGSFSLEFPSKPRVSDLQVQSVADGAVVMHVVAATPNKTTAYFFSYYDDPRFASKTVEEVLNLARDGGISGAHGALLDEQRIQIDGHPARDIQARSGMNSMINSRLIADGKRMVDLTVETAGQTVDSKDVQKFFDSLKLSK
jgi:hypothetical protein